MYSFLDLRLSGSPEFWFSGYLVSWVWGFRFFWISGFLDICFSGFLISWISDFLDFWFFGFLDFCLPGFVDCWFSGFLVFRSFLPRRIFFLEAAVSPGKCFFFNCQLNLRYAQNNLLSKPSRLLGSRELGALFLTPRTPQETRQLPRTPQGATELAQAVNQRCPNVAQARPTPLPNISLIRILTDICIYYSNIYIYIYIYMSPSRNPLP